MRPEGPRKSGAYGWLPSYRPGPRMPENFWTTVKLSLMVARAQGGGNALSIWMPTYPRTVRGLSSTSTGGFLIVQILGALVGFLIGSYRRGESAPLSGRLSPGL